MNISKIYGFLFQNNNSYKIYNEYRRKTVFTKIIVVIQSILGGYPGSNRELTVPHTVVLPIELHPPFLCRGDSNTHK